MNIEMGDRQVNVSETERKGKDVWLADSHFFRGDVYHC